MFFFLNFLYRTHVDLKNQNAAQTHDALGGEYFLFVVLLYERDYLSSEKSGSQAGRRVGSWL